MADLKTITLKKTTAFALAISAWILIALLDSQITFEIGFSIFYLIPISLATYYGGFRQGLVISVLSALAWGFNDWYTGHRYTNHWMPLWNIFMRLGYYILHSYMLRRYTTLLAYTSSLAYTDTLTGAFNTRYLARHIARLRDTGRTAKQPVTLAYIDLDNFKEVNDTHGHDEGDQVLRVLAEETRKTIGENDIFARLGGDEFVVVIPERDFTAAKQIIEQLTMNVLAAFRRRGWPVTLSIGALTYNHAAKIPVSPMQQVDQLMYKVKKTGKAAIRHQKA